MMAALKTMGMPEAIPPSIPPWLLEEVITFPSSSITKGSLFIDPSIFAPLKPEPNSIPFTPGMPNTALEI